jgi:hypothetical protein
MTSVETILRHLQDGCVTRREALAALASLLTPQNVGAVMMAVPPDVASDLERWAVTIPAQGSVVIGANLSSELGQRIAERLQVAAATVRAWTAERVIVPLSLAPGFVPSWAGPGPELDTFCFGSEDGRVLFTSLEGELLGGAESIATGTDQPINGVAFLGNRMALTTHREVIILKQADQEDIRPRRAVFPTEAHGIVATRTGYFIAPAGAAGILLVEPKSGPQIPITISRPTETLTFYKLTALSNSSGRDIVVSAMRSSGIAEITLSPGAQVGSLSLLTFPGADIVDVCALDPDSHPVAAVAVDKNCTLLLFRDVIRDRRPIPLRFDGIEGTAYRLLSCRGSLILLTTARIYFLPGLGTRFLEGDVVNGQPAPAGSLILNAIDANVVADRWILVVMRRRVLRIDMALLANQPEAGGLQKDNLLSSPVAPDWQEREMQMSEVSV